MKTFKINKYPDGTSYVTIPKDWEFSNQDITFRLNTYESYIHLIQLCEVLEYNHVNATITIPWMIEGQADRRFAQNQSSGLKIVLKRLNSMNARFKIFHPHNPEVVEALMGNVEIISNKEFIMKVIYDGKYGIAEDLNYNNFQLKENLILMSSDAGGFKSLMKLCDKIGWKGQTESCSKSRKWVNNKSELTQEVPFFNVNSDILIIDDICVYGGTFKGLSKLLKKAGHKGKLYLACSHATIQDLGVDPVTDYFDKVFFTNSKFNSYYVVGEKIRHQEEDAVILEYPSNLEIIKLFEDEG